MHWIEPKAIARERAKICNPTIVIACVALFSAVAFACLCVVVIRFRFGIWHWIGGVLGGVWGTTIGLTPFSNRYFVKQQEIELCQHEFWIRCAKKISMRYDQLRAYSIISPTIGSTVHRVLMLYPKLDSGCFSIGISPKITDQEIHAILDSQTTFLTIIDEQALSKGPD